MVASAAKAWVHTGLDGARPVAERWNEARNEATRRIPENSPLRSVQMLPCGEHEVDQINAAVAQATNERWQEQLPPDHEAPARLRLWDEFGECDGSISRSLSELPNGKKAV